MLLKYLGEEPVQVYEEATDAQVIVVKNQEIELPRWYAQNLIIPRNKTGLWERV
jgi:hypothetical protein